MSKFLSAQDYDGYDAVVDAYPEAVKIVKVDGGWMVFDTTDEYETWLEQI